MKKTLAVILGAGFALRLVCLGTRQLWTEELMQALIVRAPSLKDVLIWLKGGMFFPAPLDYILQKGVITVFGESTWSLRLHAAIFGAVSIWFFFRVGRLLFGTRAALYCTALFAIFPLHLHYSQEGRPYSLVLLLTLISYDLLLNCVAGRARGAASWLLLGCIFFLELHASILAFAAILSQLIALAYTAASPNPVTMPASDEKQEVPDLQPPGWRRLALVAVLAVLAFVLFVPWLRFAWSKPMIARAGDIASPKLILNVIKDLGDNSYPIAGLLLLGVVTGIRALLRHARRQSLIWLLAWFGVSTVAVFMFELWAGHPFAMRDVLFATPPLVLIAGYGLSHMGEQLTILPEMPHRLSSPAIVYASAMLIGCLWIAQSRWRQEPVDWFGTATALQNLAREGDALTAPRIFRLLEYYAPQLELFRKTDLDPGAGSLRTGNSLRRIVVCYDGMRPDPCAAFRDRAAADHAWSKLAFRGFTVFVRRK